MSLGGGGGSTQESTSYQTNLPEYAQPFYEEMMARTQKESLRDWNPYTGDRTADPSTMQTGVRKEVAGMTTPGGIGEAQSQLAALKGNTFDSATASQYMDPYMQQVVAEQKKQIMQDYNAQKAGRDASAVQAGAFGGGRQGAQEAVAEGEMLDRMAMAQAQGLQQSYATGREQYNTEQQQQMQLAQAQQQLATNEQALNEARMKLQNAVGAEQKAEAQRELDLAYEDFINARDNERQNLAFYNALLRGIPVPTQSSVIQYSPTNPMAQMAGLGIAGLGAYNQFGG